MAPLLIACLGASSDYGSGRAGYEASECADKNVQSTACTGAASSCRDARGVPRSAEPQDGIVSQARPFLTISLDPDAARSRWTRAWRWQLALAAYMQLISWIPLGRWNRQPCCPTGLAQLSRDALSPAEAAGMLAFLALPAAFWAGSSRWRGGHSTGRARGRRPWLAALALVGYVIWLGLQLATWWPPYLFGASERWARVYARAFAEATQVLPRWGDHLPPDAMHLALQVLLAGAVASGWSWWRSIARGARTTEGGRTSS